MKVLVACEYSGVVRDAFIRRGHDATSVDLVPSESSFGPHICGDVRDVLGDSWDLMVAHPPCTYLASSGARWWIGRQAEQNLAVMFALDLMKAPIPRIAMENPVGKLSTVWRKPDQIVQPWHFGDPHWKTTCLWLKGLPVLEHTNVVEPDKTVGGGKRPGRISSAIHRMSPGKNRQRERSRTFQGVAQAMAEQWGKAA
jgi:hypothetical protein